MALFGRKGERSLKSSSDDEFNFDEFEDMGDEFSDDYAPSGDRKASVKSYVQQHYSMKLNDREERKRLVKKALPSSYSSSVDLAMELKDDYDRLKYDLSKETDKLKAPLKELLRRNEGLLRKMRLGKAADWANEAGRGGYSDDPASVDEALVQSMLSEFTDPKAAREMQEERKLEKKIRQQEREDEVDFKNKSISLQLQGATNTGNAVAELRRIANYQDQITFLYQKKNLEIGIRSLIEHRKQTDLLRVFKEEAMVEFKEIHKNTALPEAVKINNNEVAAQLLKERMIGKAASYFDGKFGTIRRRIMLQTKDKLTAMARDFGSSLEGFNDMLAAGSESGDGPVKLLGKMFADSALDKAWVKATNKPLAWIRNKLMGNDKVVKTGKGLNAITKNLGSLLNTALLQGSTGNETLDKVVDFLGLRQAAVRRDDTMRQSLSKNLDTAAYMDIRFKQTVERVIPHWLQLIYKETHLSRIGFGFKEGDGKNGTIEYNKKTWDWNKEDLVDDKDIMSQFQAGLVDKDRVEQYGFALEDYLAHMGSDALGSEDYKVLKKWVIERLHASTNATHYELLVDISKFPRKSQENFKKMIMWKSGLSIEKIEEDIHIGQYKNGSLMMSFPRYADWCSKAADLWNNLAGKSIFDWDKIQQLINEGKGHLVEEIGLVIRNSDGSLSRNMDAELKGALDFTDIAGRNKRVNLVEGEEPETWKDKKGRTVTGGTYVQREDERDAYEDYLNKEMKLSVHSLVKLAGFLTESEYADKVGKAEKSKREKAFNDFLLRRASGGFIGRFAKGGLADFSMGGWTGDGPVDGPVHAILDGKEFVTDAATTEKNKKLLAYMNKLKASVVLPDGSVNPVYYKAFGFNNEEEFKKAHQDTNQSMDNRKMYQAMNKQGAFPYIQSLLEGIDLSKLSDEDVDKITEGKPAEALRHLNKIKEKQAKRSMGQMARDGLGSALGWLNRDRSQDKPNETLAKAKEVAKDVKKDVLKAVKGASEEQLESLFWEITQNTDPALMTEELFVYFEDPSVSWKDKVLRISALNAKSGKKGEFVKRTVSRWSDKTVGAGKDKLKSLIDGEDGNNIAELKKLGQSTKQFAQDQLQKRSAMVRAMGKDTAVDIYVAGSLETPRLTAVGFNNGDYIDEGTGRVCASHHDITGNVIVKDPTGGVKVVLTVDDIKTGLVDKDGNPIKIDILKRLRNMAKDKAKEVYGKYAKKHVDKAAGGLLSLTEKWQHMFKKTAVDIYVGAETQPRLTEVGFNEGKYVSFQTKKVLRGYLDIDGPVMKQDGTFILTLNELQNEPLRDKDGKVIKPPKLNSMLKRLLDIGLNAINFDGMKRLGGKLWSKGKGAFNKLKGDGDWKDKAKSMFTGEGGKEEGKKSRIGSWQWKKEQSEKDGWIGKLAGALGFGKKKDKDEKKKGWLSKILAGIVGVGGFIAKKLWGLGGLITKGLFGSAAFLGRLALTGMSKLVVPPLIGAIRWLGTKMGGGLSGLGGGKMGRGLMRGIGLAGGAALAYQGLKGEEKVDENGNVVLDENGNPVTERDWGTAAMGAGMMAMTIPGAMGMVGTGLAAAGSGLAAAAGFLAPMALPLAAAAAVGYGAYKGFQWLKKKGMEKEEPLLAFRMNQYGFSISDADSVATILKLETTLKDALTFSGEKANFKNDVDVESVFSCFGLKFIGGDAEKNKKFLAWFLGRFKPVFIAHSKQMRLMKNTTDLTSIDRKLTATQALEFLEKVHFKNQFDLNPYNVMISPFEDPDECDYDFEDVCDRYESVKELLTEKAKSEKPAGGTGDATSQDPKAEEDKEKETSLLKKVAMATPIGGIVAGSIWALKKLSVGAGDIFNRLTDSMSKTVGGFMDSLMSKVSSAWDKVKSIGSSIATGVDGALSTAGEVVGDAANTVGNTISSAASDTWEGIKETASNIFGGNKSADIAKVIEVGKGYNVVQTKDGSIIKQTGAWNWRNNNPGNISDGKWARKHGAIDQGKVAGKGANRFAVFPTYAAGRQAKAALIFNGENYKNLDAMAAIARYAPPHENNTANYQRTVIAAAGSNKLMKDYTNDERIKILNAMEKLEGMKAGSVQVIQKGTGPVGTPAQSTGVMASDATTGGAKGGVGTPAQSTGVMASDAITGGAKGKDALTRAATPAGAGSSGSSSGGSTKPAQTGVATSAAGGKATGALASILKLCTPELVAAGKSHVRHKDKTVTVQGMNPNFMTMFYAMVGEAKKKGAMVVQINDGMRSLAEQKRLYNLYKAKKGPLAAYPGTSRHGFGQAMDINTVNADQLEKMGLLKKYGFHRPLMKRLKNGKMTETWHIENVHVPRNGAPAAKLSTVNDTTKATSPSAATQSPTTAGATGVSSVPSTGNSSLDKVIQSGGAGYTPSISTAQGGDAMANAATNSILSQQLNVQTEMRNILSDIRSYLVKKETSAAENELQALKKPKTMQDVGNDIGNSIAELISSKLGLDKPQEPPKISPIISTKKL